MTVIAVIAKECVAGRVKTRLHPPFTPAEAAGLAAASLDDTLEAVARLPVARRILYFEGVALPALGRAFEVLQQVPGSLDERIADLFDRMTEPTLLLGMDTPQLATEHVMAALDSFAVDDGIDAWFGPAADGGFWALGLRVPRGELVRGVPMSRSDTGELQRLRLAGAGLTVAGLPLLTDADTEASAAAVAAVAPDSRFAREFRRLVAERRS